MCGIVAIVGKAAVAERLFDGLRRLEYRGYDSSGICTVHNGEFERQRAEKLELLGKAIAKQDAARKHMEAFVERFRAKASKARQAQSRLKALERMKPLQAIVEEHVTPFVFPKPEKILASAIGGGLTAWTQPIEVIRVEMQSKTEDPNRPKKLTVASTAKYIYSQNGMKGLYRGVTPRIGLGIWQTIW